MCIFFNISCFFKFLQALHESLYRVETGNYDYRYDFAFLSITPRKHRNGRNIAQYCWMLLVLSVCTPCCMLLHVVGSCYAKFETSRTFEPTTPNINFVLFCDCQSIPQQCWIRLHSSSNIALHVAYKVLWVVSFPWCTRVPTLLGVVASVSPPLPTRMQQLLTLLAKFMSNFLTQGQQLSL